MFCILLLVSYVNSGVCEVDLVVWVSVELMVMWAAGADPGLI